jgi:hypothetical protein
MDTITSYIHQNPIIAVSVAGLLLFIAGIAVRRLKIIAFIFIIIAAFAFYSLLKDDPIGKSKIENIKKEVKTEVMKTIK